MVQKPATIIREETYTKIANVINESGLPAMVVVPILQELTTQAQQIMRQQYEKDLEMYNAAIVEEAHKKEDE